MRRFMHHGRSKAQNPPQFPGFLAHCGQTRVVDQADPARSEIRCHVSWNVVLGNNLDLACDSSVSPGVVLPQQLKGRGCGLQKAAVVGLLFKVNDAHSINSGTR